ncbi:hypothetical protein [Prosthecobacter sp.]|uniref:hypothetical protein n=1 Tax=Prosthecobacter sp. TaxID=1965333 RepID=UPI0037833D67
MNTPETHPGQLLGKLRQFAQRLGLGPREEGGPASPPCAEKLRALIVARLRQIAHTRRILPERELAARLRQLESLVEELKNTDLQRANLRAQYLVLCCCVCTRMFIDALDTRFLLRGADGIGVWQEPFCKLVARVLAMAEEVVRHLKTTSRDLVTPTEQYRTSMSFRQNLAVKLVGGLPAVVDLLEADLREVKTRDYLKFVKPAAHITDEAELKIDGEDSDAIVELFFLWKTVRVLRHKLLFAAVEISHEAGPWLESIQDHLKITEGSTDLAVELIKECHESEALGPWPKWTKEVLDHVQMDVGLALRRISSRAEARGPLSPLRTDEKEVSRQIKLIAQTCLQDYANLQAIEGKIAGAVSAHLRGMEMLWEDCAVKHEDMPALISRITGAEGGDAGAVELIELPDWIDAVLLHGWSLGQDCPENVALVIFRHYAEREPKEACAYIDRFLALHTAPNVLAEHVALMFCGAIFRLARTRRAELPHWYQWHQSALRVAHRELAGHYATAGRVALSAALMSLSFQVADDIPCMEEQLHTALWHVYAGLRESTPAGEQDKVRFFARHLSRNLEGWPWAEGSALHALVVFVTENPEMEPPEGREDDAAAAAACMAAVR